MDTIRVNPHHITDVAEMTIGGAARYLTAAATTGVVPSFVGQIFITSAGAVYIAKATTADTDWVQVSN